MRIDAKWQVLIIICIGIFMSTLDGSILNIANPTIAHAFSVTMSQVQWVVTSYMLVITASLLFFGRLGDKIGSHHIYTWGFLVFAGGSLICSLANSLFILIGARAIQALGASMMMATGIGIVSNSFPVNERGKALGLTGSVVGIGNMAGPSLGGLLIANYNWPIIFLINVPIGIIGFIFAYKLLAAQPPNKSIKGYDGIGTILFALSAVMLVLSLNTNLGIYLYLLPSAIILLVVFYFFEKSIDHPMLDLGLFKIKAFLYGNLLATIAHSSHMFVTFLMPFYMERLLHLSPAYSGLVMTIPPVTMAIIAPLAGSLSDKLGSQKIVSLSFTLLTIAYLIFATLDADINLAKMVGGLIILGAGIGMFGSPNSSSILGSVGKEKAGYTGGFTATVRNLSYSVGIAASASIFTYLFTINQRQVAFVTAYSAATRMVYIIAALIAFSGLILSIISTSHQSRVSVSE